jgi:hypothetical protein
MGRQLRRVGDVLDPRPPVPAVQLFERAVGDDELAQWEAALGDLGLQLEWEVRVSDLLAAYAVALGRRSMTLWRGARSLADQGNTAAAAVLRPELEALILLGWLAADPADRLVRWHGESERTVAAMIGKSAADPNPERHARLTASISAERQAAREAAVADAKARTAKGERLLPSVEKMAEEAHGGPTFWEAYQRAYRLLSAWEHHEHATFDEAVDGDAISIGDAYFDPRAIRGLGASVTAAMLVVVGTILNATELVSAAREVRRQLLTPSDDPAQGGGSPPS